jgi:hypothetical protein
MVLKEFYYPNGELEYSYNNFKENIEYSYFNENGKLIEEFISDRGYIKYNLNKDIISISNTKHMTFVDPFKILTINQTKRMNDKMNEEEKRKSDEDWELYNNYLNNHN